MQQSATRTRVLLFWIIALLVETSVPGADRLIFQEAVLTGKSGTVEYSIAGGPWTTAIKDQKLPYNSRVQTRLQSSAIIRLADKSELQLDELSLVEIQAAPVRTRPQISFLRGFFYLFTRDAPGETPFGSPHAVGGHRGTEFEVRVTEDRTIVNVLDGEVGLTNNAGSVVVPSLRRAEAVGNQAPVITAVIQATNLVQWWLYYPAVLDVDELKFADADLAALSGAIAAYRSGELRKALQSFPEGRQPQTEAEKVFYAGLLLSAGQVQRAETVLDGIPALSLRRLIAAVNHRTMELPSSPASASEWLALSYYEQSRSERTEALERALQAARSARERAPAFGYAWAREAELEFSFGRLAQAEKALRESLRLSPRNAQARALQGFIASGQNRIAPALALFEEAIEIDPALPTAWLGRGLCRIKRGDLEQGRADIQRAAALQPNRSLLRSYLGKAYAVDQAPVPAAEELEYARQLDPNDPTSWLYSALLDRDENRVNEAVRELERSQELNDNRRLFRSGLLLDQDRAVRSSSLATIYEKAGMTEVSLREAARAVDADYGNYSAHLFLSDAYNELRDPTRFNLRYETVWFNELLLANLLAPVGAGLLSQHVSEQEYSKLFEADGFHLTTDTQWRSDGQFRELASQNGTFGNTSYSLDVEYQHNEGVRPNNELSRLEWYTTIKHQFTPQDSALLLVKYQDYHSGDNFQYADPSSSFRREFSFDEHQEPIAVAGYHHEWSPGVHTLFLGGRLSNEQEISDKNIFPTVLVTPGPGAFPTNLFSVPLDLEYEAEFEIYTAELSQIIQKQRHTSLFGVRFQTGEFETDALLFNPALLGNFADPPSSDRNSTDFERISVYGYHTWEVVRDLRLTAGLTYDQITYPVNFRNPPLEEGEKEIERWNPKAALLWSPIQNVTVRGIYAKSLGGVSFDESYRLEPAQLAGFNQSFRTIISESLVGSVTAPKFETWGGALDTKLGSSTYFGVQAQMLESDINESIGVFVSDGGGTPFAPASTKRKIDYEEQAFLVSLDHLLDQHWVIGSSYRLTRSQLHVRFPGIPTALAPDSNDIVDGDLHTLNLRAVFNHARGFFGRAEVNGYYQDLHHGNEEFAQVNLLAGWRFPRQLGELSVGVLNLNDKDYRLDPLNPYLELPRERVFVTRLKLFF